MTCPDYISTVYTYLEHKADSKDPQEDRGGCNLGRLEDSHNTEAAEDSYSREAGAGQGETGGIWRGRGYTGSGGGRGQHGQGAGTGVQSGNQGDIQVDNLGILAGKESPGVFHQHQQLELAFPGYHCK